MSQLKTLLESKRAHYSKLTGPSRPTEQIELLESLIEALEALEKMRDAPSSSVTENDETVWIIADEAIAKITNRIVGGAK